MTKIKNYTFTNCSSLTSLTIGNDVTSIGTQAFFGCSSLTSVTIGDKVTSIGENAFQNCSSLTSVTIGNRVTSIGDSAFANCTNLTDIYCKTQTPPSIGTWTFSVSNATLYIPTGRKVSYSMASGWKEFKTIIETQF
ncbi:leucine-rich repeat domain-containing protein [uncultured Alistipes sp.]|uniref:leucine-rich repeat domain-containing protein n=1 Tax=uncultured Alistipes sp. TaxID=538949 RepID=UPI00272C81C8|nr:leucine-rich repeat domain-containing protein [uncultured Alistipes sp.]